MTRVFVSHCSKDNYFVDFLAELLEFHRIRVWVDRSNLEAGQNFTAEIEEALSSCEAMIVVISKHSVESAWITRELAFFRAVDANRLVIPLVLDTEADPERVFEGLGSITQLRCYDSYRDSLSRLLGLFGRTLFPCVENRKIPDRRADERRQYSPDRRKSPVDRRLRVALDNYIEDAGRDLLEPMSHWRDVSQLMQDLAGAGSPLHSFEFIDRKSNEQVLVDFDWLRRRAHVSWRSKSKKGPADDWGMDTGQAWRYSAEDLTGAAYILDDIIDDLTAAYIVRPKDRRAAERRGDVSRREDQGRSPQSSAHSG